MHYFVICTGKWTHIMYNLLHCYNYEIRALFLSNRFSQFAAIFLKENEHSHWTTTFHFDFFFRKNLHKKKSFIWGKIFSDDSDSWTLQINNIRNIYITLDIYIPQWKYTTPACCRCMRLLQVGPGMPLTVQFGSESPMTLQKPFIFW